MIRNREAICQTLLSTGEFFVNSYFEQYLDLMCQEDQPTIKSGCQKHHILQRAYFKEHSLPLDNSKLNLINLLYRDHCLAHYLLYHCTKGTLHRANAYALLFLENKGISTKNLTEADCQKLQEQAENIEVPPLIGREDLEDCLKTHSHLEASEEFGVSLNAITKYKRKYGLPIKDRDILRRVGEENFKAYALVHSNVETAQHFRIYIQSVGVLKNHLSLPVRQKGSIEDIDPSEFKQYLQDHSNKEAAEHFGICPNSVTKLIKQLNLPLGCSSCEQQWERVGLENLQAYTSSHSIRKTADYFQISQKAVVAFRKRFGVTNLNYKSK